MIKKYFWIWMLVITFMGGFLRVVSLDKNPPHLGNDEISIAYDSYSIRTTGKDEYGTSWPLSFKSHRDYKTPLYQYLNMPLNYIFGNNEYGVRLLSSLSGVLAIVLIGLIGRLLGGEKLGLIAAILLAFNPKSIYVSRMAFESNLASTLTFLGIYFMFMFKEKLQKHNLFWSGIFFGFSIWAYHTQKGLIPLLITVLPWWWRKEIKLRKWFWLWLTTLLVIIPIGWDFVNVQIKDPYNRASSQAWYQGIFIQNYLQSTSDGLVKKSAVVLADPIYRYFEHFSLDFLFTKGMDLFPKNEPFNFGWFLLLTLPLLIIGLACLKKVFKNNSSGLLIWWLLCPIVPSLTHGEVSAVRNLPFIIPTILIMAGGFLDIFKNNKKIGIWLTLGILINFVYFAVAYFIHFPKMASDNFQYGYKQAWLYIKPMVNDYQKVVVEPRFGINGQYIGLPRLYFGYFGAFDSKEMLERDNERSRIGKFWIKNVDWSDEKVEAKSLYIVSTSNPVNGQAANNLELISKIEKTDGKPQFLIYKTK